LINALVYQDREVTSDLVGQTWTFEFDYRNADGGFGVADDTSGVSTANAFVKVLDSMSGSFAEINGARLDTSDATNTFTPGSIDFEITSDHVGQLLQFGFENFASNDSPSGVFYDTLSFAPAGAAVLGDFNGDGNVDLLDLDQYNGNIGSAPTGALADLDLDGDDDIDADDFAQHYEQLVETSNGQTGTFAGDTNLDGIVDVLVDAAKVVDNLGGTVASWANGDFNGDGTVDVLNDAAALVNNLGSDNTPTTAGVSASAVPEPSSISLLAAAVVGLAARRRR
jgi:hypothetical protein